MSKRSKGKDADAWQEPSMKALDELTKKILKVPKSELDRKLADERNNSSAKKAHG